MKLSKALLNEEEWKKYINSLKTKKGDLKKALIEAVKKRLPNSKFGIMFSGGIDSSLIALICKQLEADFVCYAVGIENSTDLIAAKKTAEMIEVELAAKEYTLEEAEAIIRSVVSIVGTDIVAVGVGCVVYACMELAKKEGINILFGGLGSEEIFAGYKRHDQSKNVNEECWKGLKKMWKRDFTRDIAIAKQMGFTVLTPFLDEELIKVAMAMPGSEKIKEGYKKYALRKVAEEIGLPKETAWRKKQAAQYGSKFDRAILRLGKRKGYKLKKEYLNSLK